MSLLTNSQSDIFHYENSKTCRACLDTLCDNYISLFDDSLVLKYTECTSLEVSENDVLPKQLCPKCVDLVQSFHEFRMRCVDSEEIFKAYIGINPDVDLKGISNTKCLEINNLKLEIKEEKDESFTDYSDEAQDFMTDTSRRPARSKIKSKKRKKPRTKDYFLSDSNNAQPKYVSLLGRRVLKNCGGICDICEKVFSYKGALIRHLETCGQNGKRVRKFNAKAEEQRLVPKSDALSCGLCHGRFNSLNEIHKHLEEHKAANDLSCRICEYQGVDFADTVCHRYSHQEEGLRTRLYCYVCSKRFTKLDHLEFHIRGLHLKRRPGVCKMCGKTFMNIKNWKAHMLMHTGVKIECDICKKSFAYHRSLVNHMKCHSDVKQFVCHLCGFACKLPTGLASHHFRRHSNNQPILCNHCGKKFKNKETLREHLLRATGERNYACAHCGKKYRNQNELDYHVKWHSDLKPFECQQCGKAYKSNTHLKNHMRKHSGERPYECGVCKSSFMTSSVLKKHAMIHTGVKPHVCQHCDKAFIEKSNLKNHLKTHK